MDTRQQHNLHLVQEFGQPLSSYEDLLIIICSISESLYEHYDSLEKPQVFNAFTSLYKVNISIKDYLLHCVHYWPLNPNNPITEHHLYLMVIYLSRCFKRLPIYANPYNIHRLLFASLITASIYLDDNSSDFNNRQFQIYFKDLGGLKDAKEVVSLVTTFLKLINHELYVSASEYQEFLDLQNYLSRRYRQIQPAPLNAEQTEAIKEQKIPAEPTTLNTRPGLTHNTQRSINLNFFNSSQASPTKKNSKGSIEKQNNTDQPGLDLKC